MTWLDGEEGEESAYQRRQAGRESARAHDWNWGTESTPTRVSEQERTLEENRRLREENERLRKEKELAEHKRLEEAREKIASNKK